MASNFFKEFKSPVKISRWGLKAHAFGFPDIHTAGREKWIEDPDNKQG